MRSYRKFLSLGIGAVVAAALALPAIAGMWSGLPAATSSPATGSLNAATLPLTGNEVSAFDTGLSGGRNPQTETISVDQLKVYMFGNLGATTSATLAADTTQWLSDGATCNSGRCLITSTSLTTAAAAFYTPTVLNSTVVAASIVNCSAQRGTGTSGSPAVIQVRTGVGVFAPVIQQVGSQANGTIKISCTVVN